MGDQLHILNFLSLRCHHVSLECLYLAIRGLRSAKCLAAVWCCCGKVADSSCGVNLRADEIKKLLKLTLEWNRNLLQWLKQMQQMVRLRAQRPQCVRRPIRSHESRVSLSRRSPVTAMSIFADRHLFTGMRLIAYTHHPTPCSQII
jgi:hypothetical protein